MQNNNSTIDKYLERVESLQKTLPPLDIRHNIINEINTDFLNETGENLPSFLLEMLGTWFLQETYSDKRTNKVSIEDFPILTDSQLLRRNRKTVQIENEYVLETLNYHLRNNSSTSKRHKEDSDGGTVYEE